MDHEGYVAMDKLVTGLRIKLSNMTEADQRTVLEPEMGLLIAATMTDRQEGLTTWCSFDPESIYLLLEEMTKATLWHDNIATKLLKDYYSQCRLTSGLNMTMLQQYGLMDAYSQGTFMIIVSLPRIFRSLLRVED